MSRGFGISLLFVLAVLALPAGFARADVMPTVQVWKSPTCGCCHKWIKHLEDHGFKVKATDMRSMAQVKRSVGLPSDLRSCHTGLVGGYVIEGHVPAPDIKRLLTEKPKIKGLAVPGMPLGSPGMEQPDGTKEPYKVLSFDEAGKTEIFETH